jgi:outer membrane biosynthesis protein TonB
VTRREISPALLGSVGLHLVVAAALLISWRFERNLTLGSVVPVTIVTDGPEAQPPAAIEAPEVQSAQAEQPTPEAPPEPVQATPQPTPPTKQPTKQPAKPEKSLDLDALAASLSKMSKSGAKTASAAQGPTRPSTAAQASKGVSAGGQAALEGLVADLERRWNPNCDVEGGRDVVVRVSFSVGSAGQLLGEVASRIASAPTPAAKVGEERAIRAVYAAAPFTRLPRELYGQRIIVNFDAKRACTL